MSLTEYQQQDHDQIKHLKTTKFQNLRTITNIKNVHNKGIKIINSEILLSKDTKNYYV